MRRALKPNNVSVQELKTEYAFFKYVNNLLGENLSSNTEGQDWTTCCNDEKTEFEFEFEFVFTAASCSQWKHFSESDVFIFQIQLHPFLTSAVDSTVSNLFQVFIEIKTIWTTEEKKYLSE